MRAMRNIQVVALTEYPIVASYAGQIFASRGTRYDWPVDRVADDQLDRELSEFYSGFLVGKLIDEFVEDPAGRAAVMRVTAHGALAIASLPKALCKRMGAVHPEKRKIKRFLEKSDIALKVLSENAANYVIRRATVHGIVNYNARILAACEAYLGGNRNERYLTEIMKGCYQISALMQAAAVFSPQWQPDPTRCRWNDIHAVVLMQLRTWQGDLNERKIWVELGECYMAIFFEPDILSAVISNVFSNIVKYGRPGMSVHVTFLRESDGFVVAFKMISRFLDPSDVQRVKMLGERGSGGSGQGEGIGLGGQRTG